MSYISKWAGHLSILSALSHVLCCGLPLLASSVSMGAVLGGAFGVASLHEHLHHYEVHMLIFSASMLALSAISLLIARRMNCIEESGCSHKPCAPKKSLSFKIFLIACILFAVNLTVYLYHIAEH